MMLSNLPTPVKKSRLRTLPTSLLKGSSPPKAKKLPLMCNWTVDHFHINCYSSQAVLRASYREDRPPTLHFIETIKYLGNALREKVKCPQR